MIKQPQVQKTILLHHNTTYHSAATLAICSFLCGVLSLSYVIMCRLQSMKILYLTLSCELYSIFKVFVLYFVAYILYQIWCIFILNNFLHILASVLCMQYIIPCNVSCIQYIVFSCCCSWYIISFSLHFLYCCPLVFQSSTAKNVSFS